MNTNNQRIETAEGIIGEVGEVGQEARPIPGREEGQEGSKPSQRFIQIYGFGGVPGQIFQELRDIGL